MNVKIHYRITQDRAGIPIDYTGARHVVFHDGEDMETIIKSKLAADYEVPESAVEICQIDR